MCAIYPWKGSVRRMSVQTIRDVLVAVVGQQVGHYKADKRWRGQYAVFGETGAPTSENADDTAEQLVLKGEIYYYTQEEYDEKVDTLCAALSEADVSWSIDAIGYDEETGQISYQIHWEVPCGAGKVYSG